MALRCPICKKPVDEPGVAASKASELFPFCSERCKLIDLGRWLDGKYQISVEAEDLSESPTSSRDEHDS